MTAVAWLLEGCVPGDAPCEVFILCAFRSPATMNLAQQPELSLAAGQAGFGDRVLGIYCFRRHCLQGRVEARDGERGSDLRGEGQGRFWVAAAAERMPLGAHLQCTAHGTPGRGHTAAEGEAGRAWHGWRAARLLQLRRRPGASWPSWPGERREARAPLVACPGTPGGQRLQQASHSLCLRSLPMCWSPLATGLLQGPGEPAALDR